MGPEVQPPVHRFHPFGHFLDGQLFVPFFIKHVFICKTGFDECSKPIEVGFLGVVGFVFRLKLPFAAFKPSEVSEVHQSRG